MQPIQFKNTEQAYGIIVIFFHWLMAILIIGLIILGLYMASLPDTGFDLKKIKLILLHKEGGMLVLILVILRLLWRLGNILPQLPSCIPFWQQFAAKIVHLAFYGFMFAMPISGWLMSSAAGIPVTILGTFTLPDLISPNIFTMGFLITVHSWLAYGLILTICLHVSAALMHHFIYKDDVLRRMLP